MLTFMVQEGILTIGAVSGIFTALLMNSFKNNIIDPVVEKIAPLDKLVDFMDDGKINNSHKKTQRMSYKCIYEIAQNYL